MNVVYVLAWIVARVAITPTFLFLVALTAMCAPGSITPMTGIPASSLTSSIARAVAVLHAITIALISCVLRNLTICLE